MDKANTMRERWVDHHIATAPGGDLRDTDQDHLVQIGVDHPKRVTEILGVTDGTGQSDLAAGEISVRTQQVPVTLSLILNPLKDPTGKTIGIG